MSKRKQDAQEGLPAVELDHQETEFLNAPVEPVLPQPPAAVVKVAAPVRGEGMIRLEVFLRLTGKKADQLVPFARWAKKQRLLPRPMAEWKALFNQFLNRPVTG
ncbi:MAG: hypothetical protein WC789_07055 [Lentisphaeria bacterium]